MGRQVKRVPMDFDWPLHKVWPGYYLSLCDVMDEDCESCKRFAKLAGIASKYECPEVQIDPPNGEGYQIWETVSEGSPISPVFRAPELLAQWMVDHDTSITRDATFEIWVNFINGPGWAPSMVGVGGKLISGVAATEGD